MSQATPPKRDDFDEYARDYADLMEESLAATGADRDFFAWNRVDWIRRLEGAAGRTPARILDLGCGDGATEIYVEAAFPDARISGVDVSAQSVAVAAGRGLEHCDFSAFDGHALPFADAAFDVVFVAGVLHHVPEDANRHELLAEVYRVLKPAGSAYVFEQNPANPVTRRIVDRCPFDKYARLLKAPELMDLMRAAGFEDAQTYFILFSPRHSIFAPIHAIEPWLRRVPIGAQYFGVAEKPSRRD